MTHLPLPLSPGDLTVESSVYEWLIDDDNRELQGTLEEVNRHMLNRLIEYNPFVAVVFISKMGNVCFHLLNIVWRLNPCATPILCAVA